MENGVPNPKELGEIREKGFTSMVAMVTAFFAVILSMASLGESRATKEMLLSQQQSSNHWAHYQAKTIREHLYKSQAALLENEMTLLSESANPQTAEKVKSSIKALLNEAERYSKEKKEIEKEARKLEKERDEANAKIPYFEFSRALLEIAIVMASVSIIALSGALFGFPIAVAVIGAFMTLDGFLQIVQLPFLH